MEQCSVHLPVEIIPGNTAISAPILPRERELNLGHAQWCNFQIIEESSCNLAVEKFHGKH
jgi:hypothetical protein